MFVGSGHDSAELTRRLKLSMMLNHITPERQRLRTFLEMLETLRL